MRARPPQYNQRNEPISDLKNGGEAVRDDRRSGVRRGTPDRVISAPNGRKARPGPAISKKRRAVALVEKAIDSLESERRQASQNVVRLDQAIDVFRELLAGIEPIPSRIFPGLPPAMIETLSRALNRFTPRANGEDGAPTPNTP